MAVNRCFDTFIPNSFSSDYTNTTRQKTVFNDVNNNIIKLGTANPTKKNGFTYNSNFGVRSANNAQEQHACLAFATNHELLLDITKGKTIMKNICPDIINREQPIDAPVFDAWSGNLYSVNYTQHNVDKVVEFADVITKTKSYNVVDPTHQLFYNSCALTDQTGYPPQWFRTVDISFNNTAYYREANRAQILNGLQYPEKVVFGTRGLPPSAPI